MTQPLSNKIEMIRLHVCESAKISYFSVTVLRIAGHVTCSSHFIQDLLIFQG